MGITALNAQLLLDRVAQITLIGESQSVVNVSGILYGLNSLVLVLVVRWTRQSRALWQR